MSHHSAVWKFFTINAVDNSHATCNLCKTSVSRGSQPNAYNTTNLRAHLKRKHPAEHDRLIGMDKSDNGASSTDKQASATTQQSLVAVIERGKMWPSDSQEAMKLHRKLIEMIALDDQPFSVVNDIGFRRLMKTAVPRYALPSDTYVRETLLPTLYEAVKTRVAEKLSGIAKVSVTTDGWSTSSSTESLMSLTAHWIDDQWERKSAILHCAQVAGSHTASKIAEMMTQMVTDWKLKDRLHVCVRDNARNMEKGLQEAGIQSVGCFAHTLQLCVNDGITCQRIVVDAVANCRKVAGHFSHSQ